MKTQQLREELAKLSSATISAERYYSFNQVIAFCINIGQIKEDNEEYNDLILTLIPGDTLKDKFDYIKNLLWENNSITEIELLNIIYGLKKKGQDLKNSLGSGSYVERCAIFDAEKKIYHLTNKRKIEKLTFGNFLSNVKII